MSIDFSTYSLVNRFFAVAGTNNGPPIGTISSTSNPYTILPSTFPSAPNYYSGVLTSGSITGGTYEAFNAATAAEFINLVTAIDMFIDAYPYLTLSFTSGQTTTITPGIAYSTTSPLSTLTLPATSVLEFDGAGTYVIFAQAFVFNGNMILTNGATANNIFFYTPNQYVGGVGNITFNASDPNYNYYGIYIGGDPYFSSTDTNITLTSGNFNGCLFNRSSGVIELNNSYFQSETLCFIKGTRILTEHGYKPVQNLGVGDKVVSYANIMDNCTIKFHSKPILSSIIWIQHFFPTEKNTESYPIRFSKGSLGTDSPSNDLWVSPGHRMIVGDKMVSAMDLVNGTTIVQETNMTDIEYFHFETESHEVVEAEGTKTETFINFDYDFRKLPTLHYTTSFMKEEGRIVST